MYLSATNLLTPTPCKHIHLPTQPLTHLATCNLPQHTQPIPPSPHTFTLNHQLPPPEQSAYPFTQHLNLHPQPPTSFPTTTSLTPLPRTRSPSTTYFLPTTPSLTPFTPHHTGNRLRERKHHYSFVSNVVWAREHRLWRESGGRQVITFETGAFIHALRDRE